MKCSNSVHCANFGIIAHLTNMKPSYYAHILLLLCLGTIIQIMDYCLDK